MIFYQKNLLQATNCMSTIGCGYENPAIFQIENSRSGRYNLITAGGQTKKGVFKKWKKNFISLAISPS